MQTFHNTSVNWYLYCLCVCLWFFILVLYRSLKFWYRDNDYGRTYNRFLPYKWKLPLLCTVYSCVVLLLSAPDCAFFKNCSLIVSVMLYVWSNLFVHYLERKSNQHSIWTWLSHVSSICLRDGMSSFIKCVPGLTNLNRSSYWKHVMQVNAWLNAQTTRVSIRTDTPLS